MTAQKRIQSRTKKRALKRKISTFQRLIGICLAIGIFLPSAVQSVGTFGYIFEPQPENFRYLTLPTGALNIKKAKPQTPQSYTAPKVASEVQPKVEKIQQVSVEAANSDEAVWEKLAKLESGGNWQTNTGNGYYGGLQFSQPTWESVGGKGLPCDASRDEQIMRGKILQKRSGWGQWPNTSRALGLY